MDPRKWWRRSGHCVAFSPLDLTLIGGFLVLVVVVPVLVVVTAIGTVIGLTFSSRSKVTVRTDASVPEGRGEADPGRKPDVCCPVCSGSLEDETTVACPRCRAVHHRDCWELNGGCSVFGCSATPRVGSRAEFEVLQRRFRRWFWLTRIRFWSQLLLASLGAAGFFVLPLSLRSFPVLTLIVPLLCVWVASGVLWALAVLARYRLDSVEYRLPSIPRWRWASLLRRVEHSRSLPILERVVFWMPVVYFLATIVVLAGVVVGGRDPSGIVWTGGSLVVGGLFVGFAVWSARRHVVTLEQVRRRLPGSGAS